MDNKLSELSKPVVWVPKSQLAMVNSGDAVLVEADLCAVQRFNEDPLYSQEYVSALLAELEFEKQNNAGVAGMVEDYETKLEAKDKRIAELEGSATLLTNQRDLWYGKVQDLEAKLATPVRLKKVDSSNVPYAGDGFNAAVDYCADRVRAAGFTVEGDE